MIVQSELSQALTEYYMPYAMKVITDRALPDVKDGLKPIARRILWNMWKNGLTHTNPKEKCGKIVGDVLKIHNHGDVSIYNALALLTEENESLLQPFISGGGAFGKVYSKDSPSAMRYTSARLNKFSEEMFKDIDKNIVKFIGEDKDHIQPLFLSNTFPNILIKPNSGLAVGEACNWCSFNLKEVCELTSAYINDKNINVIDYLTAPDFTTGGYVITSKSNLEKIYSQGRGNFKLQAKYKYDKSDNSIQIYEIPYNTTVEDIIKDVNGLISKGKIKDINDIKDDTGYDKLLKKEIMGISIELKRGADFNKVMQLLYKYTRLTTSFSCNFNCLVNYKPRVLGIKDVLDEWLSFRIDCVKKAIEYDIKDKTKTLHFLKGLEKALLNIDKAIDIIRYSETDELINENLMNEFKIDTIQATDISNMKLKNINKKYIIKRLQTINDFENEIIKLQSTLNSQDSINEIIINDLERISKTYAKPRRTELVYEDQIEDIKKEDLIEDNAVTIIFTKEQYLKKTLKYSENQTVKDEDKVIQILQTTNKKDLLLFTNKGRVFTRKIYELTGKVECTPSALGEYIPNILKDNLDKDEKIIYIASPDTYDKGYMLYIFQNNNIVKMAMKPYYSIQNRQVAQDAYNTESPLKYIKYIEKDIDILTLSSEGKMLIQNTEGINPKTSQGGKKSQGNSFVKLDDNDLVGVIFEPKENDIIRFKTEKKDCVEINLSDICQSSKDKLTYYNHCRGKKNNSGSFIYNCRQKNDSAIEVLLS